MNRPAFSRQPQTTSEERHMRRAPELKIRIGKWLEASTVGIEPIAAMVALAIVLLWRSGGAVVVTKRGDERRHVCLVIVSKCGGSLRRDVRVCHPSAPGDLTAARPLIN
jgi:hypothetical protein